jgi:3',5'-cyclic AMP phosphodiesterase CpdA
MLIAMKLCHLSDLHLTRYGEHRYWTQLEQSEEGWEKLHGWQGWRIEGKRDRKQRPEKLRLVDPGGVVHEVRKWPRGSDDKVVSKMVTVAMERHMTSVEALVQRRPTHEDLRTMLRVDPNNPNLRFLQVCDQVLAKGPEIVAITGDHTDNGFGYGLIQHFLEPWVKEGRLLVVPGNHDTYDMFPRKGRRDRVTIKEDAYRAFAGAVGCDSAEHGAYVRYIDDLAFVGLSSCKEPFVALSASGEVTQPQLTWLRELAEKPEYKKARLRLGMVHHHLLRMPMELGKRSPIEVGLRLRNAVEVMKACTEAKIDILLNGHRHHGYMVQLPDHPMVVSSPSSTWGCKSSNSRYVWMMDLEPKHPHPLAYKFSDDPATPEEEQGSDAA